MLSVDLLYLGNEKDENYNKAAEEYGKRLSAFCTFRGKNIKDERLPEDPSEKEIGRALEKEADKIRTEFSPRHYKIALCVEGKSMSSPDFAHLLETLPDRGYSGVTFVIGSSFGLSEKLKKECDLRLSVSPMTFPHKLFRVMLLEQIYRAFSISAGTRYHK